MGQPKVEVYSDVHRKLVKYRNATHVWQYVLHTLSESPVRLITLCHILRHDMSCYEVAIWNHLWHCGSDAVRVAASSSAKLDSSSF